MNMHQQIYIAIAVGVLAIIAVLMIIFKKKKPQAKLSTLSALAFVFVIAGIAFGDSRLVGYSLIGVGIVLALIDMVYKFKK
jgi:lipopolysaccharide export LptBFGC system permease protein LptF